MDVDGSRRRARSATTRSRRCCQAPNARTATTRHRSAEAQADWLQQVNGSFLVAAYRAARLPRRRHAVAPISRSPAHALLGLGRGALSVRQHDGPPAGALVDRRASRSSTSRRRFASIIPEERFVFGYYPRRSSDGSDSQSPATPATLDAAGRLDVDVPVGRATRLRLSLHVREPTSRTSRASTSPTVASLVVHPAPFYVGLRRPAISRTRRSGTSVDVVDGGPARQRDQPACRSRVSLMRDAVELGAPRGGQRLLHVGDRRGRECPPASGR